MIPWRRDRIPTPVFPVFLVFPGGSDRVCLQCRRPGFYPRIGKIPWRRAWPPTPIFLPGESPWAEKPGGLQSMGSQRVGHNLVTECTCTHTDTHTYFNNMDLPDFIEHFFSLGHLDISSFSLILKSAKINTGFCILHKKKKILYKV